MNFKINFGYFLAFLALLFLVHECHDWLHVISARIICGCWGIKRFDNWTICDQCNPTSFQHAAILLSGPVINYIAIWLGWLLMKPENTLNKKSLGFSLFFAALPLPRMLAATEGGSDETSGLKLLFPNAEASHHHVVTLAGLALIILLSLPAFIRALLLMRGWIGKAVVIPAFLVAPIFFDKWIVNGLMNKLLSTGFLSQPAFAGTSWLLVVWFCLLAAVVWVEKNKLMIFLKP
jgi:hypothetical protein